MPGARILLVEDDDILRDLLTRNLTVREHEVSIAKDAQTALAYLRATPFDLIILDINLPDQTGWEILRTALREGWLHPQNIDGDGQKLPVIVLSAVRVGPGRLAEFHPLAVWTGREGSELAIGDVMRTHHNCCTKRFHNAFMTLPPYTRTREGEAPPGSWPATLPAGPLSEEMPSRVNKRLLWLSIIVYK